mmetsp:Transcript_8922/g.10948  ORF Transcript_8922/g.10948 Transcript_8922/m.10948 type:complete len:126 (+) Transcript_8922:728-1105(+)
MIRLGGGEWEESGLCVRVVLILVSERGGILMGDGGRIDMGMAGDAGIDSTSDNDGGGGGGGGLISAFICIGGFDVNGTGSGGGMDLPAAAEGNRIDVFLAGGNNCAFLVAGGGGGGGGGGIIFAS